MPLFLSSRSAFWLVLLCIGGLVSCDKKEVTPDKTAPPKKDTCIVAKSTETRTGLSAGTTPMTYEYDAQKRLVKKVYHFEDAPTEYSISFQYDVNNRLVKVTSLGSSSTTYMYHHEYDAQGRRLKSTLQYSTYAITYKNTYGSNGKLTSTDTEHSDGWKSYSTYDSNGNLTRTDTEYSDGRKSYSTFTYANGNLVAARSYSDGAMHETTYEHYLDQPNVVTEESSWIFNLSATDKNLLKTAHTNSDIFGDINFTYEFTDKGYIAKVTSHSPAFHTVHAYEYNCD